MRKAATRAAMGMGPLAWRDCSRTAPATKPPWSTCRNGIRCRYHVRAAGTDPLRCSWRTGFLCQTTPVSMRQESSRSRTIGEHHLECGSCFFCLRRDERQVRVVVIDDDPMFLRLIQKAFETAEPAAVVLSATGFARGRAALRQLDQLGLLPDLILIDRSLGDGNGVEMLEFLRAEAVFAGVPAVMVSAVVDG